MSDFLINNASFPSLEKTIGIDNISKEKVDVPFGSQIGDDVIKPMNDAIEQLTNDNLVEGIIKISFEQFVENLKKFLDEQNESTVVKELKTNLDSSITEISSKISENASIDKDEIKKSLDSIDNTEDNALKINLNNDFVKQITDNILGIINLKLIVNSTIKHTVETIKSLIDGNVDEFKRNLSEELNKGLGTDKFSNIGSEKGEDILSKETNASNDILDLENNVDNALKDETNTDDITQQFNEIKNEADDANKTTEKELDKPIKEKQNKDTQEESQQSKKQNINENKLLEDQKKLDLQRKQKLLAADNSLDATNKSLKKIIELQDVIEEYDARKEFDSKESDKYTKAATPTIDKKKDDTAESKELDLEMEDDKETSNSLGIGLAIGALCAILILLRGYSSHTALKNYIAAHADEDPKTVEFELNTELDNANKEIKKLENELNTANEEIDTAESEVKTLTVELMEANNIVNSEFKRNNEEIKQDDNIQSINYQLDSSAIQKDIEQDKELMALLEPEIYVVDQQNEQLQGQVSNETNNQSSKISTSNTSSPTKFKSTVDQQSNSLEDLDASDFDYSDLETDIKNRVLHSKNRNEIKEKISEIDEKLEKISLEFEQTNTTAERDMKTMKQISDSVVQKDIDNSGEIRDTNEESEKNIKNIRNDSKGKRNKYEKRAETSEAALSEETHNLIRYIEEETIPRSEYNRATNIVEKSVDELNDKNALIQSIGSDLDSSTKAIDDEIKKIQNIDKMASETMGEDEFIASKELDNNEIIERTIDALLREIDRMAIEETIQPSRAQIDRNSLNEFYSNLHATKLMLLSLVSKQSEAQNNSDVQHALRQMYMNGNKQ